MGVFQPIRSVMGLHAQHKVGVRVGVFQPILSVRGFHAQHKSGVRVRVFQPIRSVRGLHTQHKVGVRVGVFQPIQSVRGLHVQHKVGVRVRMRVFQPIQSGEGGGGLHAQQHKRGGRGCTPCCHGRVFMHAYRLQCLVLYFACLTSKEHTKCLSGTDPHRQVGVLPHWERRCRRNLPSHSVMIYSHRVS